jgi:hypothetical protein
VFKLLNNYETVQHIDIILVTKIEAAERDFREARSTSRPLLTQEEPITADVEICS